MIFLYVLVAVAVSAQIIFIYHIVSNYQYVLKKFNKNHTSYRRKTALIVPCKGIDTAFDKNIRSFYELDYEDYEMIFVTESSEDQAHSRLLALKEEFKNLTKAFDVKVLIAGRAQQGSQKLHNLLYACGNVDKDVTVFAFADSDACVRINWLNEIVYPLRKDRYGVTGGYRWYVPTRNNFATLALSILNAKVAQLLGVTRFNHAWGGSMAVRVEVFKKLGIEKIWEKSASDDLTLSQAVKKAGLRVIFVPACFVASYEKIDFLRLLEFARRQFLITRITAPGTWWLGVFSSLYPLFGLWGFAGIALYLYNRAFDGWYIFLLVSFLFLVGQFLCAVLRQKMIFRIFPADWPRMKVAAIADIAGNIFWSWLMLFCILSSLFGRTIKWRGVKYKLKGPTEVVRL
ncbi:MAG: glycosyltransferase family 2 protein [Planctomycetes bacterium]|nr:glycosyltransferase family 2 protein [Planctomycetota bacterium]MBU1518226.1 glycosyltransferase family 2 protein [Planctomycetota bacterium]MBU2457561.1 glycosyltransferase family 2 protein [Planctomycetota bacterium]MBU2597057.1 glycosyltransferase family 2 protein [Planctomycetota bacterium]